ncbi:MAG: class D sortase [Agathobaculum desmolans]|uniref:class D sortase n=1 Tax=Agathobaculum desmolans TaxID=39484 RepID=UPI0039920E5E
MRNTIKRAAGGALVCGLLVLSIPCVSALEYHYDADLYDNHFYTPTSGNHALDLDSKDDSGGSAIVVPSDSMDTDTDQTAPRAGSPIIPVGSYIDPWGSAVEKQIATDETLNGLEGLSFNRLEGMGGSYTDQHRLATTNGHFGAVSIGSRGLFAYVYPGATAESMRKGAGHVDGTSVWNGNVTLCGHNRGSWPYFGNLKYVQIGDVVTYKTSLGIRTYRVTFAGRILATDTDVLNPTAGNRITMLTCVANEPAYRFCVIGQEMR